MSSVDFTGWAEPPLELTLGGRVFTMPPPSVALGGTLAALTAHTEVQLGWASGPLDANFRTLVDKLGEKPLGEVVFAECTMLADMVEAGASQRTIDRMAFYAMLFWARGKERADAIAQAIWAKRAAESGDASPKGSPRSPSTSGPSTG